MDSRIVINITDEDKQESLSDDGRVLFSLISRIARQRQSTLISLTAYIRASASSGRSTGSCARR